MHLEKRSKYYPKNVILLERSSKYKTSWLNPQNDNIVHIFIYDTTNGTDVLLSTSFNSGSGAVNSLYINSVTPAKTNTYKIVFEFSNHEATEYIMSAYPSSTMGMSTSAWTFEVNNTTDSNVISKGYRAGYQELS